MLGKLCDAVHDGRTPGQDDACGKYVFIPGFDNFLVSKIQDFLRPETR